MFICLLQSGGMILIFRFQQYCVQNGMEQELNDKQTRFSKLILSVPDFQKSRISSHEISLNGEMYDVKSIKYSDNKVELLVIKDTKEESIIANIKLLVNNSGQRSPLPDNLIKLLTLDYTCPHSTNVFLLQDQVIQLQRTFNFPFCENIISFKCEISSPPPKLV